MMVRLRILVPGFARERSRQPCSPKPLAWPRRRCILQHLPHLFLPYAGQRAPQALTSPSKRTAPSPPRRQTQNTASHQAPSMHWHRLTPRCAPIAGCSGGKPKPKVMMAASWRMACRNSQDEPHHELRGNVGGTMAQRDARRALPQLARNFGEPTRGIAAPRHERRLRKARPMRHGNADGHAKPASRLHRR